MVDARLRRLCEKKPSGKLNVPQDIHNMWLAGGHSRDNLRALLEKFEFDKGKFISEVTVMIEKRRENSEKVKSGWFTPDQMRTELKWVSSYIKDAVAYCKKHGLVKNDKYSNKVYKYFVEYSDTATLKKSYIETEKQSSTREGEEVKLGGGFLERPEEPETAPDESERHQALSAQEEELLVEQKFEDGMLAKMSKITDLIARLEGLSKSSPEDSARCTKLVQALEAKIQAAQAAFDTFVECRSQVIAMDNIACACGVCFFDSHRPDILTSWFPWAEGIRAGPEPELHGFARMVGNGVSCRDAIRQARVTRNPSKGLQRLAAVPLKKSETGAHQTFKAFGQSLDLKISRVDLVSKSRFPYVSLSDWLKYVVENDSLEQIVGVKDLQDMQPLLTTFWSRFRFSHPHHKMYDPLESGAPQHHSMTIPIVMHGDEGRGRKKKQITILSWMGLLGRGSSRCSGSGSSGDPEPVCSLNLLGSTWLTHFLHSVLPVGLYSNQPEALDEVFALQARELATLFYDGVEIGGRVFYVACVGVKGDVPFLTKCGGFIRSYTRKPTAKSSRKAGVGICHLCCAGKEDFEYPVPFEELGVEHPSWLSTVGLEKPYSSDPPYALVPFERDGTDVGKLYRFDIFHNLHLGLGKSFVSSAVCMVLELCQGMSIGAAFGKLSEDFRRYCVRNSESPYHKTLKASLFGVHTGFKECPDGAWSKGDYTRLLLEWFGDYCSREVGGRTDDPVYLLCVSNRHSVYLFFGL
ncbi:unnamed protein product [Durusdinium trenchii]|uniref:Uncharacterized protein n=1 Tax=Durusdinium trenchii TaxID=1381693 RepID=A0ABP0L0X2_9DINO